jgi:hypothetical protein
MARADRARETARLPGMPPPGPPTRRARLTTRSIGIGLIAALAAFGFVLGIGTAIIHLTQDPLADVRAYYDAGARLNAGQPLYVDIVDTNVPGSYQYPPLLAIAFRPLALLPYGVAALIWEAVLIGATILTFMRLDVRKPGLFVLAGLLALPLAWTLAIGQAQALVTYLLALGAPWAVAIATDLKLYPALVAAYWVGRREWRRLGLFAAWSVALLALQLVLEPSGTLAYVGFVTSERVGGVGNLSPYAVSPVLWLAAVVILGIAALRLAPTRWGWAAAVVLSVLASPRLLSYQLSTLLAAFAGPDARSRAAPDLRPGSDAPDRPGRRVPGGQ